MKILFLNPRLPYPLISGDRVKSYHLLKHLAKEHDVTLVSYFQGSRFPEVFENKVRNLGVQTFTFPLSPVTAGLNAAKHLFEMPLEIAYYTGRKFKKKVGELLENENFDIAVSFFMRASEYLKNKDLPKILIAEDCRILYQQRSYQKSRNPLQKFVRLWEYLHLLSYEPKTVNRFDITTCVTKTDIENMRLRSPNADFMLLTNGVDLEYFKPADIFSQRSGIVFTGKLDVYSNTMMAQEIILQLFPKIKRQIPNSQLTIAGAKAPSSLTAFRSNSINIKSDVPEMLPYYQNARVFLHPHRGASGIQNKVLEAMACGCCVVTTPTGVQGIPAKHGKNVMISNSKMELVENTLKLLKDDTLAENISTNARKAIENSHSWETVYRQMDAVLERINTKK